MIIPFSKAQHLLWNTSCLKKMEHNKTAGVAPKKTNKHRSSKAPFHVGRFDKDLHLDPLALPGGLPSLVDHAFHHHGIARLGFAHQVAKDRPEAFRRNWDGLGSPGLVDKEVFNGASSDLIIHHSLFFIIIIPNNHTWDGLCLGS